MTAILGMLIPLITEVLKRFVPDTASLEEIKAEISRALLDNQAALMQAMSSVMVADSQSGDKFTSRARPLVVYWSIVMITLIGGLSVFGLAGPILDAFKQVPDALWDLMTYGIGAFVLGRSVEKTASSYFNRNGRNGE